LAGLHAALSQVRSGLVVTVPCDCPFLPNELVSRLSVALAAKDAEVAVARTTARAHPVFCLCRASLLNHLAEFLAGGGRKVDSWYASLRVVEASFDDQPEAFRNFNTLEELRASDQRRVGSRDKVPPLQGEG
jgi:molybdopterin-guanine dinucleotide biosynthesis protein A